MPAKKIKSNKNTGLFIALKSAIVDVHNMSLAELQAMKNVSDATKWDGYDFGPESSEQDEDRALTDAAGAATRGYEQFGGGIAFFMPAITDTSSIVRQTRSLVAVPHTELVVVQRDGIPASAAWASGQIYNAFHVITDANAHKRGDKNRYFTIDLKPKGKSRINAISPKAAPVAVALTPPTPSVAVGKSIQLRATYEGLDITVGAKYVVSDTTKVVVTPHGKAIGIAVGTATVTPTYFGSAAGAPVTITVTAT